MDVNKIPLHVGLIMDGNGRWAKKRLMPRSYGHSAGMDAMIKIAEYAKTRGVKYLTVYTLSTENLMRPKEELDGLYSLFRKYFTKNVQKLYSQGAGVKIIGDISVLPDDVKNAFGKRRKNSPENCGFTLIFAINYGSRSELLRAVNLAVERGEKLDEKGLSALLYTDGVPDPTLL